LPVPGEPLDAPSVGDWIKVIFLIDIVAFEFLILKEGGVVEDDEIVGDDEVVEVDAVVGI
jgi:hypothetical protein